MNIYRISQSVNNDYDTYDSAVVAAENEEEAKRIHPSFIYEGGGWYDEIKKEFWMKRSTDSSTYLFEGKFGSWTNDLNAIEVEFFGQAKEGVKKGIIISSFRAG